MSDGAGGGAVSDAAGGAVGGEDVSDAAGGAVGGGGVSDAAGAAVGGAGVSDAADGTVGRAVGGFVGGGLTGFVGVNRASVADAMVAVGCGAAFVGVAISFGKNNNDCPLGIISGSGLKKEYQSGVWFEVGSMEAANTKANMVMATRPSCMPSRFSWATLLEMLARSD